MSFPIESYKLHDPRERTSRCSGMRVLSAALGQQQLFHEHDGAKEAFPFVTQPLVGLKETWGFVGLVMS